MKKIIKKLNKKIIVLLVCIGVIGATFSVVNADTKEADLGIAKVTCGTSLISNVVRAYTSIDLSANTLTVSAKIKVVSKTSGSVSYITLEDQSTTKAEICYIPPSNLVVSSVVTTHFAKRGNNEYKCETRS